MPRARKVTKPLTLRLATEKPEHVIQAEYVAWLQLAEPQRRYLGMSYAIPNFAGFHGSRVARLRSGKRAKDEGRRKAFPDFGLAFARGPHHGAFIEFKKPGEYPTAEQRAWLDALTEQGYCCAVCRSCDEAIAFTNGYDALGDHFWEQRALPTLPHQYVPHWDHTRESDT